MKKIYRILFNILICFTLIIIGSAFFIVSAQQQVAPASGIEGIWEGKLEAPGVELRIVFKISKGPDGTLTATLDSPDQGVTGIPVEEVIFKDNTLRLEVKSVGGIYEGKVSEDFLVIEGEWKQSGQTLPLTVKRVDKAVEILRPQEPKKPYPYIEEELVYENKEAGITLAGTLTLPPGKGPFPAVLLITGSGPQDRNETIFNHCPFLVLADYLTRQGVAVLRVDDRGVGKSTGDFSQATSEDFALDVLAGIEYLKTRKEINPKQIGLIGHSEGGLIAPMVAVKSPDVAFIVLMAGTGLTGEEILYLQSDLISKAMGVNEEEIAKSRQFNEKIFSVIKGEEDNEIAKERLRQMVMAYLAELSDEEKDWISDPEEYLKAQLQNLLSPWSRFFLTYDPKPTLSKVKCPVLAINGEKDFQVPPKENLSAIEEALKAGDNKNFTIKELPDLNHLFQTAQTGLPSEYAKIEETISPNALKLIGDWILEQTRDK
ncbi:MAG: alpha/beta fold hydrolase [Atribacteria sp.]|nr:alpha/beta fold hydrolase [Candidatus Atribacteria bacterium]MBU4047653.1 alpha/beta fold hydrolase [bacterium]